MTTPSTMKTDELKPCPFCGAPATMEEIEFAGNIRKSAGCTTEFCMGYQSSQTYSTHKEAIEAWNKRMPDNHAIAATREQTLRECVDVIKNFVMPKGLEPSEHRAAYNMAVEECEQAILALIDKQEEGK